MKIFLAGGITGNLFPYWRAVSGFVDVMPFSEAMEQGMKIFLAGVESRPWLAKLLTKPEDMKVYLADTSLRKAYCLEQHKQYKPYILESFYYCDQVTEKILIPYAGDFLLDSGAFTFMQGTKGAVNWDEYIERYADFINRNKVEKFFELDVDAVVGYEKVLLFRAKLERLTGRQCIPVWHGNRGTKQFEIDSKEYPYVAIGGLVTGKGEYARRLWSAFPWFIDTAHKNGAKIHALGFTSLEGITRFHFDSVDSTAWTTGNRFGFIYHFDGKTMRKQDVPAGHRINDPRVAALINYTEWIRFQRYADTHL